MDKTGIIVISLCVALLGVWLYQQNEYSKQLTHWQQTNQIAVLKAQITNNPAAAGATAANVAATAAGAIASTATMPVIFATNSPEKTLVLTNGRARYTFTTRGGGLKSVEFFDYPQTISARWKNDIHTAPGLATLNNKEIGRAHV